MANNIAVYTSIIGGKDTLKTYQNYGTDVDFIVYTDKQYMPDEIGQWNPRVPSNIFVDPCRNAKIHKVLTHMYLPEYQYTIWIDGSITLRVSPNELVEKYLDCNYDMALFKHYCRTCSYAEANECKELGLDSDNVINAQIKWYKERMFPEDYGLHECTVIIRKRSAKMERFNDMWWAEICRFSRRDQISFEYTAQRVGVKINTIPGNVYHSDLLSWQAHVK